MQLYWSTCSTNMFGYMCVCVCVCVCVCARACTRACACVSTCAHAAQQNTTFLYFILQLIHYDNYP